LVSPEVLHCPRCGAPIESAAGALSTRCKFCHAEVKLADPIALHYGVARPVALARPPVVPPPAHAAPPAEPSPFWARMRKLLLPLCAAAAGALVAQGAFIFRNDGDYAVNHPIPHALATGLVAILLLVTGRKILSSVLAIVAGAMLALKPFVLPVMVEDGRPFSTTSETHLNYLVPGVLLLGFAGLVLMSLPAKLADAKKASAADPASLRVVAATAFALGLGLFLYAHAGPTKGEVIAQYRAPFTEVRASWVRMSAKLPPPGTVTFGKRVLSPRPVWDEARPEGNNITILAAEQLTDPDRDVPHLDLLLGGDLLHVIHWTGPKNPLSRSAFGESADDFEKIFTRSLTMPYLAVYRPRAGTLSKHGGADVLEVLVFDTQTEQIVATSTTDEVKDWSGGRAEVLLALAESTGGSFRVR
jgi:hypothetical protein